MKKIISIICAACAVILAGSCSKEDPTILEVSPAELSWEWNETKVQTVTVTANYEWTARVSDESKWTLTPANDGKSFSIAPKAENPAVNTPLTATITISSKELIKTVKLTQAGAPAPTLDVSPLNLSWKWNDTKAQTITVTANYEWTATISDEVRWTLTPANDGKTFTVAPKEENMAVDLKTATISVACKELVKNITGTQAGYPFIDGHEYVDLGLPSGILWATCNVGAKNETDYGSYFAWGETAEKADYTWDTYKWGKYDSSDKTDYGMTKYNSTGPTTLEAGDDPATKLWSNKWRTPTIDEINELVYNCNWTWTTKNGVNGYTITSKINGDSIFLPAAGYREGSELEFAGEYGFYWFSSLYPSCPYDAYYIGFGLDSYDCVPKNRYYGQSIRAVTE